MTDQDRIAQATVQKLFKNDDGNPFEMTEGQISLFRAIYEKQHPRTQFECYTQYGKSDVVSMAVLLRAATFAEKWIILGGTKDKAAIIMNKLIKHLFENDYTLGKFQVSKDETLELIKRYKSKEHISFKVDDLGNMGEVLTLSADAKRKSTDAGDILIGHGAKNLIEDDAALIPDPIHGKAMRMLGGHKDNFLLKITNTFGRNHAFRSHHDKNFKNIVISYEQGLREGRLTPEYIEEMRGQLDPVMFGILYECVYPPENMVEDGGWMPLLTNDVIDAAEARAASITASGYKRLGVDIAEGTNFNAYVLRQDNVARVREKTTEKDLMKTADHIVEVRNEERILDENISVDAVGVGAGVVARLRQQTINVNAVKAGEKPTERTEEQIKSDPIEFANLRAEMYWNLKKWIEHGGALEPHRDWRQLTRIRYKEDASKRIKIMPKEEMRLRGLISITESPDVADGLSLTFSEGKKAQVFGTATPALPPYYPSIGI